MNAGALLQDLEDNSLASALPGKVVISSSFREKLPLCDRQETELSFAPHLMRSGILCEPEQASRNFCFPHKLLTWYFGLLGFSRGTELTE